MDEIVTVATQDAKNMARRLALEEGLFVGVSSGAAVSAAIEVRPLHFLFIHIEYLRSIGRLENWIAWQVASREESHGKLITTLLLSLGERYLSTPLFQDYTDTAKQLKVHNPPPREKDARLGH